MILKSSLFKKKYDTIAAVYKIITDRSKEGIITYSREAVKPEYGSWIYYLNPFLTYYVICGKSTYIIKGDNIICTYKSSLN